MGPSLTGHAQHPVHMQHVNRELVLLLDAPATYSRDFPAEVYDPVRTGLAEAVAAVDQAVRTNYTNSNTGEGM